MEHGAHGSPIHLRVLSRDVKVLVHPRATGPRSGLQVIPHPRLLQPPQSAKIKLALGQSLVTGTLASVGLAPSSAEPC